MGASTQRDSDLDDGGSGKVHAPEPRYLVVGRVLRPHGVLGELRVEVITDYPERLGQHVHFYLAHPDSPEQVQRYSIEKIRQHKEIALLKLEGCDDRNGADVLRNMLVQIPVEEAVPLEEGEYYHFQIAGVRVETEDGEWLGQVAEVLETGANDVYLVRGPRGEILLPAIADVVLELDLEARRMVVRLLPGILGE
ncbi:MAG: 16S rRNA processing protein RimM [Anaerolineae bacterium]|nr:16S rRNA processing protein RimM [Anaerolineae bacterium]